MWTDRRLFGNVCIRDPRHNSDHYMVMCCLNRASLREHARYLGGRKRLPLLPPNAPMREDIIFAALRRAVLKPRSQESRKNAWILATMWIIFDKRVSARRKIPSVNLEVGPRHKGELAGGQKMAHRGGRSGGGDTVGVGPPTSPGSLAPDQGVVQGCGQPCSTARWGYPQADHGGEGVAVHLRPAPGD